MPHIANKSLKLVHVPSASAAFEHLYDFAVTFDGYEHWGSFELCADIANARKHDTLSELRTCLFFEMRRWHHFGEAPDRAAEKYHRSLIAMIREKVAAGAIE